MCPECGAAWPEGATCQDYFNQMLYWEFEDLERFGTGHHLMVLCYHLQHPSLYSPQGLAGAMQLLVGFVVRGDTPRDVRRQQQSALDSGNRTYKITGTPEAPGAYKNSVLWTMTAADVVARGKQQYVDSIHEWTRTVYNDLRASRNLP
jgi:hypothetical protein